MVVCEVQPYDRSLRQARGILSVEESTFGECPYSPEEVASLLRGSDQHGLVALVGGRVVGFLTAFETETLGGRNLEVDLLAVHPNYQWRGIATQLLRAAVGLSETLGQESFDPSAAFRTGRAKVKPFDKLRTGLRAGVGMKRARGLVATSNLGSQKAFRKAGYRASAVIRDLMVCDVTGDVIAQATGRFIGVDALSEVEEAGYVVEHHGNTSLIPSEVLSLVRPQRHEIWMARQDNTIVGFCESVWVTTLLYRGIWIESLHTCHDDPVVLRSLIARIIGRATDAGLDKVGCVFERDLRARQRVLAEEGFRRVDEYQWFQSRVGTAR